MDDRDQNEGGGEKKSSLLENFYQKKSMGRFYYQNPEFLLFSVLDFTTLLCKNISKKS
jgi:hypothetical protein